VSRVTVGLAASCALLQVAGLSARTIAEKYCRTTTTTTTMTTTISTTRNIVMLTRWLLARQQQRQQQQQQQGFDTERQPLHPPRQETAVPDISLTIAVRHQLATSIIIPNLNSTKLSRSISRNSRYESNYQLWLELSSRDVRILNDPEIFESASLRRFCPRIRVSLRPRWIGLGLYSH